MIHSCNYCWHYDIFVRAGARACKRVGDSKKNKIKPINVDQNKTFDSSSLLPFHSFLQQLWP